MLTSIIGGAIIISGLLAGAIFGGIGVSLCVIAIGAGFLTSAMIQEKQREKRANEWRKNYPVYRY